MVVYINSIKFNRSLVDGPGVRTVVFFQGCDLRCKGCQNPSTWEIGKGTKMSTDELVAVIKQNVVNKKVTFSGGEPLVQYDALFEVVKKLDGFDIAVYTGRSKENVPQELLGYIKYLKTGPYVEELKTTVTPFVGSTNQQFWRVK